MESLTWRIRGKADGKGKKEVEHFCEDWIRKNNNSNKKSNGGGDGCNPASTKQFQNNNNFDDNVVGDKENRMGDKDKSDIGKRRS